MSPPFINYCICYIITKLKLYLNQLVKLYTVTAGPKVIPTVAQDFVGDCMFKFDDKIVKLDVWDTAGCENNFNMIPLKY